MNIFENVGKYIGNALKVVVEAPIDLTKGILEGAELINKNKKDEKEIQSNSSKQQDH